MTRLNWKVDAASTMIFYIALPSRETRLRSLSSQPPNPAEFDKQLAQAREHMQAMQAQMDKIAKTQDPQERQRLLEEHWASMQGRCRSCTACGETAALAAAAAEARA
ncbi:hypothetical protein [Sphaerotilus hippei]|uniref:hypothetical protein n=1 Tax=Sphaerotilus hippei TaxID=744406 RepID=UPI0028739007|nr:hypothetical protein [Sphaerotilus hippei]